jgi:hypothetical protein
MVEGVTGGKDIMKEYYTYIYCRRMTELTNDPGKTTYVVKFEDFKTELMELRAFETLKEAKDYVRSQYPDSVTIDPVLVPDPGDRIAVFAACRDWEEFLEAMYVPDELAALFSQRRKPACLACSELD